MTPKPSPQPADSAEPQRALPTSFVAVHFDMETQDPDDVMTLAILATHPSVELIGVSLTPGGPDQVGLVRHVLDRLGRAQIQIGGDPHREKPSVSAFHDKWLGRHTGIPTHTAAEVMAASVLRGATLLTGGPLKNCAGIPRFPRWVAQGGFAGDSVVPPEHRLAKFSGRETCPTFNFNGAPKVALDMLASPFIKEKLLVSKNVCHGVAWDAAFHEAVRGLPKRTAGLDLVFEGMSLYLDKKPEGKKLHDPLALAVAINPTVCELRRVEVYRERGEWGSRLKPESDTQISVAVHRERFFDVLTCA
jgi:pyrimidine-specific ribonucleoside hydrolase